MVKLRKGRSVEVTGSPKTGRKTLPLLLAEERKKNSIAQPPLSVVLARIKIDKESV